MTNELPTDQISNLLQAISPPTRLEILLEIGTGEACVCHLEAHLGQRQAYISQHLMALRDAGVITSRRDGRFIFYSLQDSRLIDLIRQAAMLAGVAVDENKYSISRESNQQCCCPNCAGSLVNIDSSSFVKQLEQDWKSG